MVRKVLTDIKHHTHGFKAFTLVIFIAYVGYLVYLTFFSRHYGRAVLHRSINLIPFWTINRYLTVSRSAGSALMNIVGNMLAFVPMGFLLPMVSKHRTHFFRVMLIVLFASGIIEVMQYVVGAGVSDIDDLILNALGGISGYLMYKVMTKSGIFMS